MRLRWAGATEPIGPSWGCLRLRQGPRTHAIRELKPISQRAVSYDSYRTTAGGRGSRPQRDPAMISVSEAAVGQLKELIPQEPQAKVGLRVFIQSGGCSGFSYGMGLDDNPPREDDEVVSVSGLNVYIDEYSAQYLEGAEIDYVDALMGGGFTIHNPNATRTCGCGHSFQTADGAGEARACGH
jgi:iron-sulfur cluster assembly protein